MEVVQEVFRDIVSPNITYYRNCNRGELRDSKTFMEPADLKKIEMAAWKVGRLRIPLEGIKTSICWSLGQDHTAY
jgi:hypothetical protein